jgi:hypothetical protein
MTPSPRIERVDQYDVQITGQATVLKSVIEEEDFRFVRSVSLSRRGDAIGRLQVHNVRTELIEDEFLIIGGIA